MDVVFSKDSLKIETEKTHRSVKFEILGYSQGSQQGNILSMDVILD